MSGAEQDVIHASWALGHALGGYQLAVILWIDSDDLRGDFFATLEPAAIELAAACGSGRPVTRAMATGELCAWISSERILDPDAVNSTEANLAAAGIAAAVGRCGRGLQGFTRSYEQARAAQTVARAATIPGRLTRYDDIELISLVSRDPDAMHAMIARDLHGLTGSDQTSTRLRATALAYLATGRSTAGAARRLATHRNTIVYRITQIEERLGRSLRDHDLQLELSLRLAEIYGIRDSVGAGQAE